MFTATASSDSSYVYTIVDSEDNKDHYSRFAEYLGLSVEQTPTLIFMVEASKKYVGDTSDLSVEAFKTFAEKVGSGEIKPFLKSAPIPTEETSAVKTIVGLNFRSVVLESEHEVLLKVYAPWCGHCKTIAPEFEAAAEILAGNSNIILGNFDGTLNEAEEIDIEGYPTILWYGKDKSQ